MSTGESPNDTWDEDGLDDAAFLIMPLESLQNSPWPPKPVEDFINPINTAHAVGEGESAG